MIEFGRNYGETLSLVMSLLLDKVYVPTDFHGQCEVIKEMLRSDTSGLIDSLTDFQVECALTDIKIDTESDNLNEILNEKWLEKLNSIHRGKGIERGLRGLMKEYFKERWKGASFPLLKITEWEIIDKLNLPTGMIFANGGSIYAKENKEKNKTLFGYDYFLGKDMKEEIQGEAYLMYKCFSRCFEQYPIPYLIRRGVYKHWKIIDGLKNKQYDLIKQLIPYLLHVLKGSERLEIDANKTISTPELLEVKEKIQELFNKLNKLKDEIPMRVANWDEQIKHLIPDLQNMFRGELFESAEKHILAGLGFIDLMQPISTRKDAFLNPRAFIKEINAGIKDFKLILMDLIDLIKEKNQDVEDVNHRKYNSMKWIITSKPVTEFMTEEFITILRNLSDKGLISNETISDVVGTNYEIERRRRERELERGDDVLMYPKMLQNQEDKGIDLRERTSPDEEPEEEIEEDKTDEVEKQRFNQAKVRLTGAPYSSIAELPPYIKKLSIEKQRKWMSIWNSAYKFYLKKFGDKKKAETLAFKTANSRIKQGMWQRIKSKLTHSMVEDTLEATENELIDDVIKEKKIEVLTRQNELLRRLLEKKEQNENLSG